MRNSVWLYIEEIGELIVEEYLVVGNEPVLFVCKKVGSRIRYLIMAYDYEGFEFVISPIYPNVLADMLDNSIPMEEAFRKFGYIYFISGQPDDIKVQKIESSIFRSDLLPDKGVFFDLKLAYIDRYILSLRNEISEMLDYALNCYIGHMKINITYSLETHELSQDNKSSNQQDEENNTGSSIDISAA